MRLERKLVEIKNMMGFMQEEELKSLLIELRANGRNVDLFKVVEFMLSSLHGDFTRVIDTVYDMLYSTPSELLHFLSIGINKQNKYCLYRYAGALESHYPGKVVKYINRNMKLFLCYKNSEEMRWLEEIYMMLSRAYNNIRNFPFALKYCIDGYFLQGDNCQMFLEYIEEFAKVHDEYYHFQRLVIRDIEIDNHKESFYLVETYKDKIDLLEICRALEHHQRWEYTNFIVCYYLKNNIPPFSDLISKVLKSVRTGTVGECSVCLEEKDMYKFSCEMCVHCFCIDCLERLTNTCPLCRKKPVKTFASII